jgi:Tfp pilus assembly pilus retraction ATPase PilT
VSINDYLRFLVDKSGSDLKVGGPAQARIDGELSEIHDLPVLKFDDTVRFAEEVLSPALMEKVRG